MTPGHPHTSAHTPIETDLHPNPRDWRDALARHAPHPARDQLGIPNDRPVAMSGHQPIVFHPGILAKLIALDEIARHTNAARVWIVPDQDVVKLETLRVPAGSGDDLHTRHAQILPPGSAPPGVPPASIPPIAPIDPEDQRLSELCDYLSAYTHETSLARQFASATIQLACDRLGFDPPQIIYASDMLASPDIWSLYCQNMCADPTRSIRAYNQASAHHPEARVRPLEIRDHATELSLWGLRSGLPNAPINTQNIADFKPAQLAPRALLMSGIARARLCELFIHGSGGWIYDQITEEWFRDWLGQPLAPMARVSATLRLPLDINADKYNLTRARWTLHHARHHPALVGDTEAQRTRDELVTQIHNARSAGENPQPLYQQLVRALEDHRQRNADALAQLAERVRHAQSHAQRAEIADDRTHPFPLFDEHALHTLSDLIREQMA